MTQEKAFVSISCELKTYFSAAIRKHKTTVTSRKPQSCLDYLLTILAQYLDETDSWLVGIQGLDSPSSTITVFSTSIVFHCKSGS